MPTPDDANDAYLLIEQLKDAGVEITVSVTANSIFLHATDSDGQVYQHTHDDGDLLVAACEVAERCRYEF